MAGGRRQTQGLWLVSTLVTLAAAAGTTAAHTPRERADTVPAAASTPVAPAASASTPSLPVWQPIVSDAEKATLGEVAKLAEDDLPGAIAKLRAAMLAP